jgi:putative PIN family toxin of toxin-antitoxin system
VISAVFDTVVFVRSLINPYSVWGRIVFEWDAQYRLVISQPVVLEILEVLRRPELVRKYRGVATRNAATVLTILAAAEAVEVMPIPAVSRDPKDDKFLATAAAAQVNYLVTEDADLLVLEEYRDTQILTGGAFLRILEN